MGSRLLTSSRLKAARACQRLHHIQYELGIRPTEDSHALRFGTLMHKGLEAWWKNITDSPDAAISAAAYALKQEEADPFDMMKAEVMMHGYHLRWMDEPYDVLAVEAPFETELRNPETGRPSKVWRLAGKIDAVVRDRRTGMVLVVEHKTSSSDVGPGSPYWRQLRMDSQVSVYFDGATALGFEPVGCLYDVLKKPGIRPYQVNSRRREAETPEEFKARLIEEVATDPVGFFQRGDVVRLEAEMDEARYDIWQTAQQIRESELSGRNPRNPDYCFKWGRPCPYWPVCTGEASLSDETKFKRLDDVNPELDQENAQ